MGRGFIDRRAAGRALGAELDRDYRNEDVVVLALPRGGVPVAHEVAVALGVQLDVLVVRKLGVPGREELAMGAIASGGVRIVNERVVGDLGIGESALAAAAAQEERELVRREELYRGDRPPPDIDSRTAILVDDGSATGATMAAAVIAAKARRPARVVVALPVASRTAYDVLLEEADDLVVLETHEPFTAVGAWYENFDQVSDDEVNDLMRRETFATSSRERSDG